MALKVIDGFDCYNVRDDITKRSGYLQWFTAEINLVGGRIDGVGKAMEVISSLPINASLASNLPAGFVGFALNLVGSSALGSFPAFTFGLIETNSGAVQAAITFNGSDGSITTPFGRTANNRFPVASWFFVEVGFVCSKTVGSLIVRINGVTVVNFVNVNTSPDTVNTWVNGLLFHGAQYSTNWIDDLYVCDTVAGPGANPCNAFLGDRRVFTLTPVSAGDLTQWTPVGGAANWQTQQTNDGDTSYNSSSAPGQEDLFHFSALPATVSQVIAVQVSGAYEKTDATSHTLTQRLKSGGVDAPGVGFLAPYSLGTSYVLYSDLFPVDPATGASWTTAALATGVVQAGYKLET